MNYDEHRLSEENLLVLIAIRLKGVLKRECRWCIYNWLFVFGDEISEVLIEYLLRRFWECVLSIKTILKKKTILNFMVLLYFLFYISLSSFVSTFAIETMQYFWREKFRNTFQIQYFQAVWNDMAIDHFLKRTSKCKKFLLFWRSIIYIAHQNAENLFSKVLLSKGWIKLSCRLVMFS